MDFFLLCQKTIACVYAQSPMWIFHFFLWVFDLSIGQNVWVFLEKQVLHVPKILLLSSDYKNKKSGGIGKASRNTHTHTYTYQRNIPNTSENLSFAFMVLVSSPFCISQLKNNVTYITFPHITFIYIANVYMKCFRVRRSFCWFYLKMPNNCTEGKKEHKNRTCTCAISPSLSLSLFCFCRWNLRITAPKRYQTKTFPSYQ